MKFAPLSDWFPGSGLPVIAGPCGAESREQVMMTGQALAEGGRTGLFRAGVWKPRTRPGHFEGRGEEALEWLTEMRSATGLPFAVEVASPAHVEMALKHKTDVLWIGARSTVNPFTVQDIARELKGVDIPVLIKNPVHADLQLWIGAIERIHNAGITRMAAVHRGFYFYGAHKYRNKPLWQLPIELRTLLPDLPIFSDPSHIAGTRALIPQLAQHAIDLGMDGLMIEVHHDPQNALSDAAQQLSPEQFTTLMEGLVFRAPAATADKDRLSELRRMIDEIDDDLIHNLQKRVEVIRQIGAYKKQHGITIFQLERWQEILRTRGQWADKAGLSRQHVERICQLLHEESIRVQNALMNDDEDVP